jgi:hypothetical protein
MLVKFSHKQYPSQGSRSVTIGRAMDALATAYSAADLTAVAYAGTSGPAAAGISRGRENYRRHRQTLSIEMNVLVHGSTDMVHLQWYCEARFTRRYYSGPTPTGYAATRRCDGWRPPCQSNPSRHDTLADARTGKRSATSCSAVSASPRQARDFRKNGT